MARDYAKQQRFKTRSKKNYGKKPPIPGWFWLLTGLVIGFLVGGLFYLKNFHASAMPMEESTASSKAESQNHKKSHHSKKEESSSTVTPSNHPRFDFYTMLPKMQVGRASDDETKLNESSNIKEITPLKKDSSAPNNLDLKKNDPSLLPLKGTPNTEEEQQNTVKTESLNNIDPAQNALGRFKTENKNTKKDLKSSNPPISENFVSSVPEENKLKTEDQTAQGYLVFVQDLQSDQEADRIKAKLLLAGYDVKFEPMNLAGKSLNRVLLGPFATKVEAFQAQKTLGKQHIKADIKPLK
jgi:cell division protein FtsN